MCIYIYIQTYSITVERERQREREREREREDIINIAMKSPIFTPPALETPKCPDADPTAAASRARPAGCARSARARAVPWRSSRGFLYENWAISPTSMGLVGKNAGNMVNDGEYMVNYGS